MMMYSFDWYSSFYSILPIFIALNKNRGQGKILLNKQNLLSMTEVICQQSNPLPDADPQKIYATWLTTIFSLVCNNISIKLLILELLLML